MIGAEVSEPLEDEERWALAERLVGGTRRGMGRGRRPLILVIGAFLLAVILVVIVIVVVVRFPGSVLSPARMDQAGGGVALTALLLELVGITPMATSIGLWLWWGQSSPIQSALAPADWLTATKQIAGALPVDRSRVRVLRALAQERARAALRNVVAAAGLALLGLGTLVGHGASPVGWAAAAALALFVTLGALSLGKYSICRRFLRRRDLTVKEAS